MFRQHGERRESEGLMSVRPGTVVAVLWHGTCLVVPSISWCICCHPSFLNKSRVKSGWMTFSTWVWGLEAVVLLQYHGLSKTWLYIHRHTLRSVLNVFSRSLNSVSGWIHALIQQGWRRWQGWRGGWVHVYIQSHVHPWPLFVVVKQFLKRACELPIVHCDVSVRIN